MTGRRHLFPGVATLACALFLTVAAGAHAYVYTDMRWALDETTAAYGGGTQFHISQDGDGSVSYRWLDADMTKTTVISGNSCSDLSLFGKSTFGGGDTSYHQLFSAFGGVCFIIRGRTSGGSTIAHDARLRR